MKDVEEKKKMNSLYSSLSDDQRETIRRTLLNNRQKEIERDNKREEKRLKAEKKNK